MAQDIKCLVCKCEDLSLLSRTQVKTEAFCNNPSTPTEESRKYPVVQKPVSLVYAVANKKPHLKQDRWQGIDIRSCPLTSTYEPWRKCTGSHTHQHVHKIPARARMYTHRGNKKMIVLFSPQLHEFKASPVYMRPFLKEKRKDFSTGHLKFVGHDGLNL